MAQHRKINKYQFVIGNGYHDIRIPIIEASTKAEALSKAKKYRAIPTDKIELWWVKPYLELKRIDGRLQWVEVKDATSRLAD